MEYLIIEKTISTPYVKFDHETGNLIISGESFPENAGKFYEPILEWLREYLKPEYTKDISFDIEMIYFNSSTSKIYMMMFDMMDAVAENGRKIDINWKTTEDNELVIECGEEFEEDIEFLNFNILIE
jgi:hypothetical protein